MNISFTNFRYVSELKAYDNRVKGKIWDFFKKNISGSSGKLF
jgi:hypothetical protein